MKNIYIIGRGYLAKQLSKFLSKDDKYSKYNIYQLSIERLHNKEIDHKDIIIYSNFPSINYYNELIPKNLYSHYKEIKESMRLYKDKEIIQIFLNTYRISYPTKNNLFDKFYIYFNKKLFKETRYFINTYHFFLPFIYDKSLILKPGSLFNRWFYNLNIKKKKLDFYKTILPTLPLKEFQKEFISKLDIISELDHDNGENFNSIVFSAYNKTLENLYYDNFLSYINYFNGCIKEEG